MSDSPQRNFRLVAVIALIFFVISLLTNILGPIIPDIIESFQLSLTMVALLPFSFFIAYALTSIPVGITMERLGGKPLLVVAFLLAFLGSLAFALFPAYPVAIASLFCIGVGMAMLQVVLNPLLRTVGGGEHFAFNMVLVQLVFGSASFLSPKLYSCLVTSLNSAEAPDNTAISLLSKVVPDQLAWVSVYWVFALISLLMLLMTALLRLPKVELDEEERPGAWETQKELLRNRTVILFFLGIFAYVGTEQGLANWMSKFLAIYHGFNPQTEGAATVSLFWGLFTAGGVLGLVLLKIIDSRKVLTGLAVAAITCLTFAISGGPAVARLAFPATGFFISSMWSIIFSLALNSLERFHGAFSGVLCTGVVGGAVVPLVIGALGDWLGLRAGMMILYLTLGYILSIGIWARPLVKNKTVTL